MLYEVIEPLVVGGRPADSQIGEWQHCTSCIDQSPCCPVVQLAAQVMSFQTRHHRNTSSEVAQSLSGWGAALQPVAGAAKSSYRLQYSATRSQVVLTNTDEVHPGVSANAIM